ncbi:hypothetical protein KM043_002740 [Ampulex compressa]|nr:hypothetical protein KM043_002740 [Ampulex compressa]
MALAATFAKLSLNGTKNRSWAIEELRKGRDIKKAEEQKKWEKGGGEDRFSLEGSGSAPDARHRTGRRVVFCGHSLRLLIIAPPPRCTASHGNPSGGEITSVFISSSILEPDPLSASSRSSVCRCPANLSSRDARGPGPADTPDPRASFVL